MSLARTTSRQCHDGRVRLGFFLTTFFLIAALVGPVLVPNDPYAISLTDAFAPPSFAHPLGRDELGRDLLARTVHGARLALVVAVAGVGWGAFFGVALGMWVGLRGGIVDRLVLRGIDVLLAFPGFLLALVAAAALGPGVGNLAVAVGFFSFPPFVRVARTMARAHASMDYVLAARTFGARISHIAWVHVVPNSLPPLGALAAMHMASALTTASGLSFLGLGPPLPAADWGAMLDAGRAYLWHAPRLVIVPGMALFWSATGFYLLGEGLSAAQRRHER